MQLKITTEDDIALAANICWSPTQCAKGAVIVLPATGAQMGRYANFAAALSRWGWHVICFDYRGIGASSLPADRTDSASMQAWGEIDLTAVIDWCQRNIGPRRLVIVGHSIGGQIIPMARNAHQVDAVLAVAAQKGYWRLWDNPRKLLVWGFFRLYIPICLKVLGKVRLQSAKLADLPRNVALDYARWTLQLEYRGSDGRNLTTCFENFCAPILALSFDDDLLYAPRRAVDFLMRHYYLRAPVWRCHLTPDALGLKYLGHSGFFSPRCCPESIWREISDWLLEASDGRADQFEFCHLAPADRMITKEPLPSQKTVKDPGCSPQASI